MAFLSRRLHRNMGSLSAKSCLFVSSQQPKQLRPVTTSSSSTNTSFVLRKAETQSKPQSLVILFGFYRASESAVQKYCDVYHRYGLDVVYVKSVLKHFSWPKNSVILAESLLKYLDQHCQSYNHYLVHAFSMGAYNFAVCFGSMYDKPELYLETQKKICGVVYDSLTIGSLQNMSEGVAMGVAKNALLRKLIVGLTNMYFSATHKNTVAFYDFYVNMFKERPLQIPTLLFYSRNDSLSDAKVIEEMLEKWYKKFTFPVVSQGWDKSKHAAHLVIHQEEYLQTLDCFLRNIPELAVDSKKVSSKL